MKLDFFVLTYSFSLRKTFIEQTSIEEVLYVKHYTEPLYLYN